LCTSSRPHTIFSRDWSSDVCSSDLTVLAVKGVGLQGLLLFLKIFGIHPAGLALRGIDCFRFRVPWPYIFGSDSCAHQSAKIGFLLALMLLMYGRFPHCCS